MDPFILIKKIIISLFYILNQPFISSTEPTTQKNTLNNESITNMCIAPVSSNAMNKILRLNIVRFKN